LSNTSIFTGVIRSVKPVLFVRSNRCYSFGQTGVIRSVKPVLFSLNQPYFMRVFSFC